MKANAVNAKKGAEAIKKASEVGKKQGGNPMVRIALGFGLVGAGYLISQSGIV